MRANEMFLRGIAFSSPHKKTEASLLREASVHALFISLR
jgi:hypothetical protein